MSYELVMDYDGDCYLLQDDVVLIDFDGERDPDPKGKLTVLLGHSKVRLALPDHAGNGLYMLMRHLPWTDTDDDRDVWKNHARKVARQYGWDGTWHMRSG